MSVPRWRGSFKENVMNEDVRAVKDTEPEHTREHIKRESVGIFSRIFGNYMYERKPKCKL